MIHKVLWMKVAAAMAAANLALPLTIIQADESSIVQERPATRAVDSVLGPHGELSGKILLPDGKPAANHEVILARNGQDLDRVDCDERGRFAFSNVKSGLYDLRTAHGTRIIRAWQADAAPPAARESLTLVAGPIVRGQDEWDYLEVDETIIVGIALTALTVGIIAIVEADDDDSPGSP
jgi:hypothetical protein